MNYEAPRYVIFYILLSIPPLVQNISFSTLLYCVAVSSGVELCDEMESGSGVIWVIPVLPWRDWGKPQKLDQYRLCSGWRPILKHNESRECYFNAAVSTAEVMHIWIVSWLKMLHIQQSRWIRPFKYTSLVSCRTWETGLLLLKQATRV
jgi:hypothetical protein